MLRQNTTKRAADHGWFIRLACLALVFGAAATAHSETNDAGWTVIEAAVDVRTVYVDSEAGDDRHDGLDRSQPVRTLARGKALLRDGHGDRLLLRAGRTWRESFGIWRLSGRSARQPMLIGAYGEGDRPRIVVSDEHVLNAIGKAAGNLAIVGIAMIAEGRDRTNPVGIRWVHAGDNLLLEDNVIDGFATNVIIMGGDARLSNVTLRRNIIINAHALYETPDKRPHSSGIFADDIDGLVIEQNVFDHNGWHATVDGAEATIFNHNLYLNNGNRETIVRDNVISRASSHGLNLRCGGVAEDNLLYGNALGMQLGGGTHPTAGGVEIAVRRNVILASRDIGDAPRGFGMAIANIRQGVIEHNVIANPASKADMTRGIGLVGAAQGKYGDATVGVRKLTIRENVVYECDIALMLEGEVFEDVRFEGNHMTTTSQARRLVHQEPTTKGLAGLTFSGNVYHHPLGDRMWLRMSDRARLTWGDWRQATDEADGHWRVVEYPQPSIEPHDIAGQASFEEFIHRLTTRPRGTWDESQSAREMCHAVLQRGFGVKLGDSPTPEAPR